MRINQLEEHNAARRREIEAMRDRHVSAHRARAAQPPEEAPLPALERRIAAALSARWGKGRLEPTFDVVERARHGGDLALRFPQLLKDGGPKAVVRDHLPWIVEVLRGPDLADAVAEVVTAGMYVNVTLTDRWLLDAAGTVSERGPDFCRSVSMAERIVVIDYSSPNIAKSLHAGHIRSTIVGHVLGNLYEACGALVHRVNHINDFGGFGFTLEGWDRFRDALAELPSDNARLLEIYRIRRVLERVVAAGIEPAKMEESDRALVNRYLSGAIDAKSVSAGFADYVAASDARFAALEAGEPSEVALWRDMVAWSLTDFEHFYDSLNIRFDLVIGESFYFQAGGAFVDACLAGGRALVFSAEDAASATAKLDARLAGKKIGEPERDTLVAAARKDVGAVVIPLDRDERLVVRRADGRSIYATRDLGAVVLRRQIFGMNMGVYVTGQEQQVHFDRLFRAAELTKLARAEAVGFLHVWFGFYVDKKSGKKLSSRDSVANVTQLLDDARAYFRGRVGERAQRDADVESAARELAIGSLVFNDLKQDIKGPVEIDAADLAATIAGFEKSGAAYVVYAACRARSILHRAGVAPTPVAQITSFTLDEQEVGLLLKLQQLPGKVAAAGRASNPSVLVRHLLEIATAYNSYYTVAPVIVDGSADPARLLITSAVYQALAAGLLLCHVTCPEAI